MIEKIYKHLASASFYRLFQSIIGDNNLRLVYINDFVQPKDDDKILDIGCGPGDMINWLPKNIEYTGIDISPEYINAAKKKYSGKGTFILGSTENSPIENNSFDIIIACGLIHHLTDEQTENFFIFSKEKLKKSGKLVTIDCSYYENQSSIRKFIISKDRGEHIRDKKEYLEFANKHFTSVNSSIHDNLTRIPYSHIILSCKK